MLIGRDDWQQNGVVGSTIMAVKPSGTILKFSTTRERADDYASDIHEGELDYQDELAINVNIRVKEFQGKVKFQDADAAWPETGAA